MAPVTAGHFGHSVYALKASTRVPTQITCQTFKKLPGRWDWDFRLCPSLQLGAESHALSRVPFHKGGEV